LLKAFFYQNALAVNQQLAFAQAI